MTNTPLDAPTDFIPAEDERPAGQWMEGYWAQIAPWAKRFAYIICIYYGWMIYEHLMIITLGMGVYQSALMHIGVLLLYAPMLAVGYFSYRFGQNLENALVGQDQLMLEKAFRHLHRFLLLALLMAVLWLWSSTNQWISVIQIMTKLNNRYEEPLLSE
ncbi:MAG: hypothetical protein ACKVU0_10125 [Saprospiraceae bacterium]